MVAAGNVILAIFVPAAMSSIMMIRALGSPATFSWYTGVDYFNVYMCACSLGIAAQIKTIGEPSLVFSDQWFGFIRLPSKKYKIVS
jgi:hypothetical protein